MRRSRAIFCFAAALALGAGVGVGRLLPRSVAPRAGHEHGWFADSLDLSAQQRQQMDAIWSDVRNRMGKTADHRREMDHDRDAAIRGLLSPEQSKAYDAILDDVRSKRAAMDKDREKLLHDANDRSRALLTDAQKARWEAMANDMHDHRGPPGPRWDRPATRPGPDGAGRPPPPTEPGT